MKASLGIAEVGASASEQDGASLHHIGSVYGRFGPPCRRSKAARSSCLTSQSLPALVARKSPRWHRRRSHDCSSLVRRETSASVRKGPDLWVPIWASLGQDRQRDRDVRVARSDKHVRGRTLACGFCYSGCLEADPGRPTEDAPLSKPSGQAIHFRNRAAPSFAPASARVWRRIPTGYPQDPHASVWICGGLQYEGSWQTPLRCARPAS
jgi:hypothetical protein